MTVRTGIGIDVHPLVEGRPLILGGVHIPFDRGLAGHSDGDTLVHAVIDALLGGAGLGDIGTHFPSSDQSYKDIDSMVLLERTRELVEGRMWRPTYLDATILAERPLIGPHMERIRSNLASSLGLDQEDINIKATTTDGLGFLGRTEGIAGLAVATLERMK